MDATETTERGAYSIPSFCRTHEISRSHYYDLRAEGKGPREFRAGRKVLISVEAARDWRRRMEAQSVEASA